MNGIINNESEDWWDDSKSFDGINRSKELKDIKNKEPSEYIVGKIFYMKIEPHHRQYQRDRLTPNDFYHWDSYYKNPIKFEIVDFDSNSYTRIKCTLLKIETKYHTFRDTTFHVKSVEIEYGIKLYFNKDKITISGYDYFYVEYIPKDSAIVLFDLNKKIYPNFKPKMDSIFEERGPGWNSVTPIKG